jgi:hypothetical protein
MARRPAVPAGVKIGTSDLWAELLLLLYNLGATPPLWTS